jgi:opacity protein-like surface antigen
MNKRTNAIILSLLGFLLLARPGLAAEGLSPLSVKLSLGASFGSDGDYGAFVNDFENFSKYFAAVLGANKSGKLEWPRMGNALGAELIWGVSRRFGLGLGIGSLTKSEKSTIELEPYSFLVGNFDFKLSSTALTLSAYYLYPLTAKVAVILKGGPGYFWGRGRYIMSVLGSGDDQTFNGDIRDRALGFQGSLGLEFKISNHISLFAEGSGRLVKLSNWQGDQTVADHGISRTITSAPVWHMTEQYSGLGVFFNSIYFGPEPHGPSVKDVRRFEVDLSGLAIQLGVRIGFGR